MTDDSKEDSVREVREELVEETETKVAGGRGAGIARAAAISREVKAGRMTEEEAREKLQNPVKGA